MATFLGLVGCALSLAGLVIALSQLSRTQEATKAAAKAAADTTRALDDTHLLHQMGVSSSELLEVRRYLVDGKLDAAWLRVDDAIGTLARLRHTAAYADEALQAEFQREISRLVSVRSQLENATLQGDPLDLGAQMHAVSRTSDWINERVGSALFGREESGEE